MVKAPMSRQGKEPGGLVAQPHGDGAEDELAEMSARVGAVMQRQGRQVATLDLLIATAALLDEASIVTRNARDFARVPGLAGVGYPPLCLPVTNAVEGRNVQLW